MSVPEGSSQKGEHRGTPQGLQRLRHEEVPYGPYPGDPPEKLSKRLSRAMGTWSNTFIKERASLVTAILAVLLILWTSTLVLVPLFLPADTVNFGEDGLSGRQDHAEDIEDADMDGFSERVYASGDRNCHQNCSRSLIINGNQMPYCSRCFAIFMGTAIGLTFCIWRRVELQLWLIMVGIFPLGLDGGLQWLSHDANIITWFSYESTNTVRMITGIFCGFMTGAMLAFIGRTIGDGLLTTSLGRAYSRWRDRGRSPDRKEYGGSGWKGDGKSP